MKSFSTINLGLVPLVISVLVCTCNAEKQKNWNFHLKDFVEAHLRLFDEQGWPEDGLLLGSFDGDDWLLNTVQLGNFKNLKQIGDANETITLDQDVLMKFETDISLDSLEMTAVDGIISNINTTFNGEILQNITITIEKPVINWKIQIFRCKPNYNFPFNRISLKNISQAQLHHNETVYDITEFFVKHLIVPFNNKFTKVGPHLWYCNK